MRNAILIFAVFLAACAGAETDDAPEPGGPSPTTAVEEGAPPETQAPSDAPTEVPDSSPAEANIPDGEVVLTIGDETWEFQGALCEWYELEPGSPEFEAVAADQGSPGNWEISSIQSDLLITVIGFVGVGITDVANFPQTVNWQSADRSFSFDGDSVSFTGSFMDFANLDSQTLRDGTLTARCSWVEVGGLDQFTDPLG